MCLVNKRYWEDEPGAWSIDLFGRNPFLLFLGPWMVEGGTMCPIMASD
jgi:hypothetical protein